MSEEGDPRGHTHHETSLVLFRVLSWIVCLRHSMSDCLDDLKIIRQRRRGGLGELRREVFTGVDELISLEPILLVV